MNLDLRHRQRSFVDRFTTHDRGDRFRYKIHLWIYNGMPILCGGSSAKIWKMFTCDLWVSVSTDRLFFISALLHRHHGWVLKWIWTLRVIEGIMVVSMVVGGPQALIEPPTTNNVSRWDTALPVGHTILSVWLQRRRHCWGSLKLLNSFATLLLDHRNDDNVSATHLNGSIRSVGDQNMLCVPGQLRSTGH